MNRIMVWILAGLMALALVYRIANPPEPISPGPVGRFPTWKSRAAMGEMAAQAANPSGTAWAGVWNEVPKSGGEISTAVWIIDFKSFTAKMHKLPKEFPAASLAWADDKIVRVLTVNSPKPKQVEESKVVYIDAKTADRERTVRLKTPVTRVLAWPAGDGIMLAELATEGAGTKLAALTQDGKLVGKEVEPKLDRKAELYTEAAISKDSKVAVFSVTDENAKGGRAFYVANMDTGASEHAFDLFDIPDRGRIEGLWAAPAAPVKAVATEGGGSPLVPADVLMVCSKENAFALAKWSPSAKKPVLVKSGLSDELKTTWLGVPKSMLFVTYTGGYEFNTATGKAKRLFKFKNTSEADDYWRQEIRSGRLYPINGRFISVSTIANTMDIRELAKDGSRLRDLLPRF